MGRDLEGRIERLEARLLAPAVPKRLMILRWVNADTISANGEPFARVQGESDEALAQRAVGEPPRTGLMLVIGPTCRPDVARP